MEANIGGLNQPLRCDLIQVLERSEGPTVEQVLGNIRKWPFNFTLRLGPMRAASPGLKAVVSGKGQKAGVVNGLVAIISGHHNFHVVVYAGDAQTTEILKR